VAFFFQILFDRIGKAWVSQPMSAIGLDWQQSPCHFVLTLRTTFKPLYAFGNAPSYGLVVTGFKVQTVDAL
jgi:hypothetical protein